MCTRQARCSTTYSRGAPPFAGDSAAVTLQKVLTEEPARPRALNPSIPRDLETICLKCLEKDAAKRYPTAQALADDLLRYLRNEPISVRPAGAVERGYKWVKRNAVVASAMAAVSLVLVTGTGVSLGFGLEAQKQAEAAKQKQKDADDAAEREKGEANRANDEAARADREKRDAIEARNDLKAKKRRTRPLARTGEPHAGEGAARPDHREEPRQPADAVRSGSALADRGTPAQRGGADVPRRSDPDALRARTVGMSGRIRLPRRSSASISRALARSRSSWFTPGTQ